MMARLKTGMTLEETTGMEMKESTRLKTGMTLKIASAEAEDEGAEVPM